MGANTNKFPGASATQKVWLDGVMNSDDEEEDYEEYKGLEKYENELNNEESKMHQIRLWLVMMMRMILTSTQ